MREVRKKGRDTGRVRVGKESGRLGEEVTEKLNMEDGKRMIE